MWVIGIIAVLLSAWVFVEGTPGAQPRKISVFTFIAGAELVVFTLPSIDQPTTFWGYVGTALIAPIAAVLALSWADPTDGRRR